MTDRYDVIIAGAGPSGAMAANLLGQAGCRVLVLEREKLPRYKPCAGGVSARIFSELPAPCADAIERQVTRVRLLLNTEEEVSHDLAGEPIAMVSRERFDYLLISQAQATVHDGEGIIAVEDEPGGVSVSTASGAHYQADYCVGADGAFSVVARHAGLRAGRFLGPALEAEVPLSPSRMEPFATTSVFLLGTVPKGYVWAFPKSDRVSFGVGACGGGGLALRQALVSAARQLGIPIDGMQPKGHALPMYRRREPLQRGRVLLVGDAAGLLDPLSGEGVRHALHSGRLASEAILSGDAAGYSARVDREIGVHLRAGYWLAQLFYTFPRLCFKVGARSPVAVAGLARMLAGEVSYGDLIQRVPGFLLSRLLGRRPQARQ